MFGILCDLRAEVLGKDGVFIPFTIPDPTPKDGGEEEEEADYSCQLCSTDISELPGEDGLFRYQCGNKCIVLCCKPSLLEWILNHKQLAGGEVDCNCPYCRTPTYRFLSKNLSWKQTRQEAKLEDPEDRFYLIDAFPEAGRMNTEGSLGSLLEQFSNPGFLERVRTPISERNENSTIAVEISGTAVPHLILWDLTMEALNTILREARNAIDLISFQREFWAEIKSKRLSGWKTTIKSPCRMFLKISKDSREQGRRLLSLGIKEFWAVVEQRDEETAIRDGRTNERDAGSEE